MAIISRGFAGRRSAGEVKLPPGQYLTTDFPVLSAGPTPRISLDRWGAPYRLNPVGGLANLLAEQGLFLLSRR